MMMMVQHAGPAGRLSPERRMKVLAAGGELQGWCEVSSSRGGGTPWMLGYGLGSVIGEASVSLISLTAADRVIPVCVRARPTRHR